jgi:hypothetical protein
MDRAGTSSASASASGDAIARSKNRKSSTRNGITRVLFFLEATSTTFAATGAQPTSE